MERRKFLQHAGIAGILAAGAAPAVHAQQTAIRWRLASSFPKALDTIYGAAETFSQHVKEMSGGKFEFLPRVHLTACSLLRSQPASFPQPIRRSVTKTKKQKREFHT